MDYEQALAYAKSGKAILFLGSGFSYGLESILGEKIPTASGLAKRLCEESGSTLTENLKKASTRYLEKKSTEDLVNLLQNLFTVRNSSKAHEEIANIDWLRVYTTNYDNVFEVSAEINKKRFYPVDMEKQPRGNIQKQTVIHINGYINSLTENKLKDTFKLTDRSYLTVSFRNSNWSEVFKRDVQTASAIFFIGYSLYDIEIQEILFIDEANKKKTFFIDRQDLTKEEIEDLDISSFGKVCPIGIENFSNDLKSVDTNAISNQEIFINNFNELELNEHSTRFPIYGDIKELLSFGKIDNELFTNEILNNSNNDYIIKREIEDLCLKHIISNKNLILYSSLANGKTILSKSICLKMINKGFKTYILKDIYDVNLASLEAEQIIKNFSNVIFVIENYTKHLDLIKLINFSRVNNTKLLLLSRTTEHERNINDVLMDKKILEAHETTEECLDKLTESDVDSFTKYLERYGLWQELAGYKLHEKKNYIFTDARKEISSILLGILKSEQVQDKINQLYLEVKDSDTLLKTIVSILCLNIVNIQNPSNYLISALAGEGGFSSLQLRSSSAFNHIIYKNNDGYYFPKSSIFANHFFQTFPDQKLLVETLIIICKNIRKKVVYNQDIYMQIYRDLASYKNASLLMSSQRASLIEFYEGLREIKEERDYPHFWLQYAIALISIPSEKNLEDALSHLRTALSISKNWQSYWVDDINTQLARCYIEKSYFLNKKVHNIAFNNYSISISYMIKVLNGSRVRTESLRPLGKYFSAYEKFKDVFNAEQINHIQDKCEIISKLISKKLPNPRNRDQYFLRAIDNIDKISTDIKLIKHINENT